MSLSGTMGKKSRIVPLEAPLPIPKPKPEPTPRLRVKAEFGTPLNIKPKGTFTGPSLQGYKGVATWEVVSTDDQILQYLEVAERIGNVHKLYHGTPAKNIEAIAQEGLRPGGSHCMFGSGIYMGMPPKAIGYARGLQAHYLLEVEVALGKIKPCMNAQKHTLALLRAEGYDSVGGFAGQTASWGGTLRHNEYVVYSPDQVLVTRVHEFQQVATVVPIVQTEGACQLVIEKDVFVGAGNRTFADVLRMRLCEAKSYTKVNVRYEGHLGSWDKPTKTIWICKACIERFKLRVGSKITVRADHYRQKNRTAWICG